MFLDTKVFESCYIRNITWSWLREVVRVVCRRKTGDVWGVSFLEKIRHLELTLLASRSYPSMSWELEEWAYVRWSTPKS